MRSFPDTSRGRSRRSSFQRARPHLPGRLEGLREPGTSRGRGRTEGAGCPGRARPARGRAGRADVDDDQGGVVSGFSGLARVTPGGALRGQGGSRRSTRTSGLALAVRREARRASELPKSRAASQGPGPAFRRRRGFSHFLAHPRHGTRPGNREGVRSAARGTLLCPRCLPGLFASEGSLPHPSSPGKVL